MVSRTAALPVAPIGDRTEPGGTGSADRLDQFFETACDRTPSAVALAGPAGPARLGAELADFLQERGVTVLYASRRCWRPFRTTSRGSAASSWAVRHAPAHPSNGGADRDGGCSIRTDPPKRP